MTLKKMTDTRYVLKNPDGDTLASLSYREGYDPNYGAPVWKLDLSSNANLTLLTQSEAAVAITLRGE